MFLMLRPFPSAAPVRRLRLYEEIAARVAAYILDHGIAVGGRLPAEGEIARSLGVSRPAVREAIVALETAGIVIARSGGGLFVLRRPRRGAPLPWARRGDPGPGPREQLRARRLIEPEIAAEAARVATPAQIDELDAQARAIAAAANAGLPFAEEAVEWHIALAEAAGVAPLADFLPRLLDSAHHAMWRTIRAKSETDEQCSARTGFRERLVAALRSRDAEAARRHMQEHLDAAAAATFGSSEEAATA
ncbi:FadR/GntR family transcriptional regulator [Falsiroseomonas sp. E2-1-a20]|uniref:FadR/GntR family transcriptional regulator n=1 Tax=Falsiroseomonas sp. E2-1-a20 TaxID=3239300 RepID=UPI003F2A3C86